MPTEMSNVFSIFVNKHPSKPEYGTICANVSGVAFPDKSWTDFALDILMDWGIRATEIMNTGSSLHVFHEGPVSISVTRRGEDRVLIACQRRHAKAGPLPQCEIHLQDYQRAVLDACEKYRDQAIDDTHECRERFDSVIQDLKSAISGAL